MDRFIIYIRYMVLAVSLTGLPAIPNVMAVTVDTAAMSGFVWNDLNDNGIQEANESGRASVQVVLRNETCTVGVDCPVTTTDADGSYGFASLTPGTYDVLVTDEDDEFTLLLTIPLLAGTETVVPIALGSFGYALAAAGITTTSIETTGAAAAGAATTGAEAAGTAAAAATTAGITTGAVAAIVATVAVIAITANDDDDFVSPE